MIGEELSDQAQTTAAVKHIETRAWQVKVECSAEIARQNTHHLHL